MRNLMQVFPNVEDLIALAPDDLAGPVLEVSRAVQQNGRFSVNDFLHGCFPVVGNSYPEGYRNPVMYAVAEALSWLHINGLIVPDPTQVTSFYVHTREGKTIRRRADMDAYRQAKLLPRDLLQPVLIEKVWHLYARGDYDTAVFQAYKEVEVAVFEASNAKGAGFTGADFGKDLMGKAFKVEGGPLTDMSRVVPERQGDISLFMGAMGHAKNPASHRNVGHDPQACAKLILFASYLLDIVAARAAMP